MKLSDIKLNPGNPRLIKDERFKRLVQSISDFPKMMSLRPIVIDSDGVILGGNMRYRALKELKYKEIPDEWVKRAEELTDDERKRFIIEDNVPFGEWDWDILANEWDKDELVAWGLELPDAWGETSPTQGLTDPDAIPEDVDPVCKPGDIWRLGGHRIMCGDSTKIGDVEKLMSGEKADMVFTDPPYGVDYEGKTKDKLKIKNDSGDETSLLAIISSSFDNTDLAIREGAYCFATVPAGPLHILFADDWKRRGWLRQIMVWVKDSMVLGHSEYHYQHEPILFGWKPGGERLKNTDRTKTTVWSFDRPKASREHPTMKPVEMWAYGITQHTNPKDGVYDPFCGSGTTVISCEKTGRRCFGMEIDPHYCDVIIKRWEDFTGNKAEKLN